MRDGSHPAPLCSLSPVSPLWLPMNWPPQGREKESSHHRKNHASAQSLLPQSVSPMQEQINTSLDAQYPHTLTFEPAPEGTATAAKPIRSNVFLQFMLERLGCAHALFHGAALALLLGLRSPAAWERAVAVLWAAVEPLRLLGGMAGNLRESPILLAASALVSALLTIPLTLALLLSNSPGNNAAPAVAVEGSIYLLALAVYAVQLPAFIRAIVEVLPSPTTPAPSSRE